MKKFDLITILGIFALALWCIDITNNIFYFHKPLWSLWFSSVGIGLTGVALLTRNAFLLNSLFCALFVVETAWNVGFFYHVLFHKSFMGLTDYLFNGHYSVKDFYLNLYHVAILPFLIIGIWKEKIVYKNAWMGAAFYAAVLILCTYFFASPPDKTNCVYSLDDCKAFLFFLENEPIFVRIPIGIGILTFLIFIPTNYLFIRLFEKRGKIIS